MEIFQNIQLFVTPYLNKANPCVGVVNFELWNTFLHFLQLKYQKTLSIDPIKVELLNISFIFAPSFFFDSFIHLKLYLLFIFPQTKKVIFIKKLHVWRNFVRSRPKKCNFLERCQNHKKSFIGKVTCKKNCWNWATDKISSSFTMYIATGFS